MSQTTSICAVVEVESSEKGHGFFLMFRSDICIRDRGLSLKSEKKRETTATNETQLGTCPGPRPVVATPFEPFVALACSSCYHMSLNVVKATTTHRMYIGAARVPLGNPTPISGRIFLIPIHSHTHTHTHTHTTSPSPHNHGQGPTPQKDSHPIRFEAPSLHRRQAIRAPIKGSSYGLHDGR